VPGAKNRSNLDTEILLSHFFLLVYQSTNSVLKEIGWLALAGWCYLIQRILNILMFFA
jgi:hypothetical protein